MLDRLPQDILLRVITCYERGEYDPSTLRSGHALRVAHQLSQICSSLRAFVLNVYLGRTLSKADFTHVSCDDFLCRGTMSALARAPRLVQLSASYAHCRRSPDGESGDAVIAPLLQHAAMQKLMLCGMSGVTDDFLFGATLPSLEVLDLTYVAAVSSASMRAISRFGSLRVLVLLGCTNVDNNALEALWGPMCVGGSLVELNVAYCAVTDVGLRRTLSAAHCLQRLVLASRGCNLWATGSYSEAGVASLQELFPGVIHFQV